MADSCKSGKTRKRKSGDPVNPKKRQKDSATETETDDINTTPVESATSACHPSECSKMAEALLTSQDSFSCPVCRDQLKDPVTIPCGHNFCLGCIKDCWDQDDQSEVYNCPQCRTSFTPRPALNKNSLIAEMVENVKKTRLSVDSPAAPVGSGSGDVECDICTGVKHRAVKSCLACLASYCEAHIQTHYESPALKKHKLIDASVNLQEKICSHHDKLLEIFCRTDQQFLCYLCVMDEHSAHKTVSAAAEKTEKQDQLEQNQETCKQKIQQKEKDVQELREVMEHFRRSAQTAVEDSEKIFTELIESIERRRSEVKELIRAQEKTEIGLAEELLKNLEQEIAELRKRDAELEQLSHTDDPIYFLKRFQSLPALPAETDLSGINTNPQFSIEFVKKYISEMEQLNRFRQLEITEIYKVYTVQEAEPKTREEFLKCFCKLTLNLSMSHTNLCVAAENYVSWIAQRNVNYPMKRQIVYVGHPENWCQVLCTQALSGRCYWEVEISGDVSIAVSYKEFNWQTNGTQREFGSNGTSWSLECVDSNLCFRQNQGRSHLGVRLPSSKIGVYVDHSRGILSFYSISDTVTFLHRVNTTFTQPLYAGFGLKSKNSSVLICHPS